jgi:hypothetical protein
MADTQRTRAAILALFADNVTGQISAQDLRDFVVTLMPSEFMYAGDFWVEPLAEYITTDMSVRGFIEYSQIAGADISALKPVCKNSLGYWEMANVSAATTRPAIGLAANSYASNASDIQILRRGYAMNASWSVRFSNYIGQPVYLCSGNSVGSLSITATTVQQILGIYEAHGKIRFDPQWAIIS